MEQGRPRVEVRMSNDWEEKKALAEAASAAGRFEEAETIWLAALATTEAFATSDPRLFSTIEQLTIVALKHSNWSPLQTSGAHPAYGTLGQLASQIIDLVDFYYSRKRYAKAEMLCLRLLHIYEHEMGPTHADVGTIVQNLAAIYRQIGLVQKSEAFTQRALEIRSEAIQAQMKASKNDLDHEKKSAVATCKVCGREILGSARPISGQKCMRCTEVAMATGSLEKNILKEVKKQK
jgi:tetratricopeptide (TPR) repeat protein